MPLSASRSEVDRAGESPTGRSRVGSAQSGRNRSRPNRTRLGVDALDEPQAECVDARHVGAPSKGAAGFECAPTRSPAGTRAGVGRGEAAGKLIRRTGFGTFATRDCAGIRPIQDVRRSRPTRTLPVPMPARIGTVSVKATTTSTGHAGAQRRPSARCPTVQFGSVHVACTRRPPQRARSPGADL